MSKGMEIMEFIIFSGLVKAECEGLCVWSANACEQLDAWFKDADRKLCEAVNPLEEEVE